MIDIKVDVVGRLPIQQQLNLLRLPPAKRRRILSRVGRRLVQDARKRVRAQVDLNGKPYPARWRKRKDGGKMLARLAKRLAVVTASGTEAKVGFKAGVEGRIGAEQQAGKTQTVSPRTKTTDGSRSGMGYYKKPATKRQAHALIELGFKVRHGNESPGMAGRVASKRDTVKYIMTNMTVGQAGWATARILEWQGTQKRASWVTHLPARSFLGATAAEVDAHILDIYQQILKGA